MDAQRLAARHEQARQSFPRAQRILEFVAALNEVSLEAICGPSRRMSVSVVRSAACRLLRRATPLSFQDIGDLVNRHHSTVIHYIQSDNPVAQKMADDAAMRLLLVESEGAEP